jgi:hypothetical protein
VEKRPGELGRHPLQWDAGLAEPPLVPRLGSGIGGYVANITPEFGEDHEDGTPTRVGWQASRWSIGLADLVNHLADSYQRWDFHPTRRLVPEPSPLHPIDAERTSA